LELQNFRLNTTILCCTEDRHRKHYVCDWYFRFVATLLVFGAGIISAIEVSTLIDSMFKKDWPGLTFSVLQWADFLIYSVQVNLPKINCSLVLNLRRNVGPNNLFKYLQMMAEHRENIRKLGRIRTRMPRRKASSAVSHDQLPPTRGHAHKSNHELMWTPSRKDGVSGFQNPNTCTHCNRPVPGHIDRIPAPGFRRPSPPLPRRNTVKNGNYYESPREPSEIDPYEVEEL